MTRRAITSITVLALAGCVAYMLNLCGFGRVVDTALAALATTPQAATAKLRELTGDRGVTPDVPDHLPEGTFDPGKASTELAKLTVASPASSRGYDRQEFPHWTAHDGECDTREHVLQRDGRDVATGLGCQLTSGTWTNPYTGVQERRVSDVEIDHVTSLAEAWRTGAARWTRSQRRDFANDTRNLLAVSRGTNQSKSDRNAAMWRPPLTRYHCVFARIVITVKASYRLTVAEVEKRSLAAMIATCTSWNPLAAAVMGSPPARNGHRRDVVRADTACSRRPRDASQSAQGPRLRC